jgi:hypothetical protein
MRYKTALFVLILTLITLSCTKNETYNNYASMMAHGRIKHIFEDFLHSPGIFDDYAVTVLDVRASSHASNNDECFRYNPWKILDNDINTAWKEGVPGAGIGEYLEVIFQKHTYINIIEIMPGDFTAKSFFQNNRIKKLYVIVDDSKEEFVRVKKIIEEEKKNNPNQ